MKHITIIAVLIFIIGCNSDQGKKNSNSNTTVVSDFLMDISSLENIENENGITLFEVSASKEATEIINLSKDNIESFLNEAKNYKHCVIVIKDHTIVKVKDYDNCKQSGSWGVCMPYVEGYIKKGDLVHREDYMNNIIGLPDSQKRTAYLFN